MIVRELMTGAAITAPPGMPILEARSLMMKERIRHLPVAAADGRLLGIITDRDIRLNLPSQATSLSVWEINHLLSVQAHRRPGHDAGGDYGGTRPPRARRRPADGGPPDRSAPRGGRRTPDRHRHRDRPPQGVHPHGRSLGGPARLASAGIGRDRERQARAGGGRRDRFPGHLSATPAPVRLLRREALMCRGPRVAPALHHGGERKVNAPTPRRARVCEWET
jgi:CBS domain-containing protein